MALITMRLRTFRLMMLGIVVLFGLLFLGTQQGKFIQNNGFSLYAITSGTGLPQNVVTLDDYNTGTCTQVRQQYTTIECAIREGANEKALQTISTSDTEDGGFWSFLQDKYTVEFIPEVVGGTISVEFGATGLHVGQVFYLYDANTGEAICSQLEVPSAEYTSTCQGMPVTKGYKYKAVFYSGTGKVHITGQVPWLYYSNADQPTPQKIMGTSYCQYGKWVQSVTLPDGSKTDELLDVAGNVAKELSNPGSVSDITAVEPNTFRRARIDGTDVIVLSLGTSWRIPYDITEKSKLINPKTYNGLIVECNVGDQKLYAYEKIMAGNTCYLQSGNIVLKDGEKEEGLFCCDDFTCGVMGAEYACVDYVCAKGESTLGCNRDSDCNADTYIQRESGAYKLDYYCKLSTHTCEKTETLVECNPFGTYSNQCCKDIGNGWQLFPGDSAYCKGLGKRDCASYYGPDACCLDTQTDYTTKSCTAGLVCCEQSKGSGIGACKDKCEAVTGTWWEELIKWLAMALGLGGAAIGITIATIIVIALAVLIVIGIVKSIIPQLATPFIRGGGAPQSGVPLVINSPPTTGSNTMDMLLQLELIKLIRDERNR